VPAGDGGGAGVIPDLGATWTYDGSHYPEPLTPMTASVWFEAMGLGIQAACRELRAPFGGFRTATLGHWAYESEVEPDWEPDPAAFREACLGVAARWEGGLAAAVERGTAEMRALRPAVSPQEVNTDGHAAIENDAFFTWDLSSCRNLNRWSTIAFMKLKCGE